MSSTEGEDNIREDSPIHPYLMIIDIDRVYDDSIHHDICLPLLYHYYYYYYPNNKKNNSLLHQYCSFDNYPDMWDYSIMMTRYDTLLVNGGS